MNYLMNSLFQTSVTGFFVRKNCKVAHYVRGISCSAYSGNVWSH